MTTKIRDEIGESQAKELHRRLDEFLDDKAGFIILYTINPNKATDYYHGLCVSHIREIQEQMVNDFDKALPGFLPKNKEKENV